MLKHSLWFTSIAFLLLLIGCGTKEPHQEQSGAGGGKKTTGEVQLLVTGNANGLLVPCDCEMGPLGGLAKRGVLFDSLDNGNAVRINLGGTIDELTTPSVYPDAVRALELLEYDLLLPAKQDRALLAEAQVQDAANWLTKPGRYVIERDSVVLIFHVFSDLWDDAAEHRPSKPGVLEADTSAEKDTVEIWLTHVPEDRLPELPATCPAPDAILAGGTLLTAPQVDTLEGAPVYRPSADGMDLLNLSIRFEQGEPVIRGDVHWVDHHIREREDVKALLHKVERR